LQHDPEWFGGAVNVGGQPFCAAIMSLIVARFLILPRRMSRVSPQESAIFGACGGSFHCGATNSSCVSIISSCEGLRAWTASAFRSGHQILADRRRRFAFRDDMPSGDPGTFFDGHREKLHDSLLLSVVLFFRRKKVPKNAEDRSGSSDPPCVFTPFR
jgi:hypothetical protein